LGGVTDQSGSVIAGATVTATDTHRGVSRTLTTDDAGQYSAPNLTPGAYTVRAEFKGFEAIERLNIGLEVGKEIRVDFTLQPGQVSQTITITEQLPMVETTNATMGGTLNNASINDLPLNGRNFQNLMSLRPGVSSYPGGGARTQSANGIRAEDQVYMLDGLNNTEPFTGYNMVNQTNLAGDTGTMVSIDAIQEFNTEENPKAEFGWKPGAVVGIGIKSGTNDIHGTAFAFGRTDAMDARNFFNYESQPICATIPVDCNKQSVSLEQFGATIGGPIKKDKLFYFASYEDQRYSVGNLYNIDAPITNAAPNATLTTGPGSTSTDSLQQGCLAAKATPGGVSANSLTLAGLDPSCNPLSNYPGLFPVNNSGGVGTVSSATSSQQSDNGLAKITYHINDHNDINGTTFIGRGAGTYMDAAYEVQPQWLTVANMWVGVVEGSWVYTPNSSWVNEVRAGYDRFDRSYLSADHNMNPQDYVINGVNYSLNTGVTLPLEYGFPIIRFSNFNSANFRLGGNWPKVIGPNGVIQILDHVSYLHGNHSFRFGGEILTNKDTSAITANAKGQIRFADITRFFEGVTKSNSQILVGNPTRNVSDQGYAVFFEDDWRIKPRLTLNLGVRWEMATVMKEANNQFGNFDPNSATGLVQVGNGISSPYRGDHNNVAPRLGLAWDVAGNGKTVVRAGAGIYYEELTEMQSFLALANVLGMGSVPTGACLNVPPAGTPCTTAGGNLMYSPLVFGNGALNWNGSTVGGSSIFPVSQQLNCALTPCTIFAVQPNLRTPYVSAWNLDIQRAITNNLSLSVAYVGNHGTKLLGNTDLNQPPLNSGGTECPGGPYCTKFPYLNYIDSLSNIAKSNYHGLQVALTERPVHGLSFTMGYTYSHALDDVSDNFGLGNTGVPLDSAHYASFLYGPSDFDIRHRFTLTTTYAFPNKKSFAQLLEGWQLNSLVTIQSGAPWYPQDTGNDFAGNGAVTNPAILDAGWDFRGKPSDFTSNQYNIPFCSGPGSCVDQFGNPIASATATTMWTACTTADTANGATTLTSNLTGGLATGCFLRGSSVMTPPPAGTFPTMTRNMFRDSGYKNWDLSVYKNFRFGERLKAQFRAEFFNVLNHPNFANPYGGANGYANNDPSAGFGMGCGCATPDQAAQNPVLGSGGARDLQLGLKLLF
jgi:Carboxypeptidase regulatory-like domain/TonB dependent receptor